MSVLRPGGLDLTRDALKKAGVRPGAALLDVGCGDGEAAFLAQEEFSLRVTAVDTDENAVEKASARGLDAKKMDASALEFPSRSFDAVLMECVFSLLDRQLESMHEAYCMLRPGGKLIMTDLYRRVPELERWREDYATAMDLYLKPRSDGDCENGSKLPSPYCQDGALVLDGLALLLDELELQVVHFEDRTEDLKAFAAQAILDCGSIENYFAEHGNCLPDCKLPPDVGYFLLIAEKRNA